MNDLQTRPKRLQGTQAGRDAGIRWDLFLKTLTDRLAQPDPSFPSVRCVTRQTLVHLIGDVANELQLPSTFPSGKRVIDHLVSMGLASDVPVEVISRAGPSRDFVLLGIQDSRESRIDPLELLQAYDQRGVVCYFSALSYYDLTTQIPPFHHIASLTEPRPEPGAETSERVSESNEVAKRSKLGTHVFSYRGVPFYSTKRSRTSIPGVKTRVFSPATNIHIATMEQTLLDALQYPLRCGGPDVVLESWQQHVEKADEDLLLAYLNAIQLLPLARRVGALFELLGFRPARQLASYLEATKASIREHPEMPWIPLLRGVPYSRESAEWKVLVS